MLERYVFISKHAGSELFLQVESMMIGRGSSFSTLIKCCSLPPVSINKTEYGKDESSTSSISSSNNSLFKSSMN